MGNTKIKLLTELLLALLIGLAQALSAQGPPSATTPPASEQPTVTESRAATEPSGDAQPTRRAIPGSATGRLMTVKIGQITQLQGSMPNELRGIGLVTGLSNTGGGDAASRLAAQNFIRTNQLNITSEQLTTGAFSLVAVNATLPAFAKVGQRVPARVSTMSDAESLYGGYLQLAVLRGPDNKVYSTASGPLVVSGWQAKAGGATAVRNHVTVATIPGGATINIAPKSYFLSELGDLELRLINPSLRTAQNITDAIVPVLRGTQCTASVVDRTLVRIHLPRDLQKTNDAAIRLLNLIRPLRVVPEHPNAVVIDPDAGAILAGADVLISPCVVSLSDLTITIVSEDEISQPAPGISLGNTERVRRTRIDVSVNETDPTPIEGGATVAELVANLRALQLSPRQLINVFEHLRSQGYLHAELVVR